MEKKLSPREFLTTQFVTYKIALKLREMGFDEPCIAYWKDEIDDFAPNLYSNFSINHSTVTYYKSTEGSGLKKLIAPLWQQAVDWILENYTVGYCIIENDPSISYNDREENFLKFLESAQRKIDIIKYAEECQIITNDLFSLSLLSDMDEAKKILRQFCKELCNKTLHLAAEKATIIYEGDTPYVNRNSILNIIKNIK